MLRRTALYSLVVILLIFGWSNAGRASDWGPASLRLSENMTEQEAINAVGQPPNMAELDTCGSKTPNPWECRILTFGNRFDTLQILFYQDRDHIWRVTGWKVYQ